MLVDSCHHIQLYLDNKREKLLQLGKKQSATSFCYVVIKKPLKAINKGYPGHFVCEIVYSLRNSNVDISATSEMIMKAHKSYVDLYCNWKYNK